MSDPSPQQGTIFRNLVKGPSSVSRSFFTKAVIGPPVTPLPPDDLQTHLRKALYVPPPRSKFYAALFAPTVLGPYVPPVVIPPDPDPVPEDDDVLTLTVLSLDGTLTLTPVPED